MVLTRLGGWFLVFLILILIYELSSNGLNIKIGITKPFAITSHNENIFLSDFNHFWVIRHEI